MHMLLKSYDIDTRRMPCLFLSIITAFDFNVYSLQNMWTAYEVSPAIKVTL